MELTPSFLALLQSFVPIFTTPTSTTFGQIVTGWIFSQRHLFITEIIFSGGNVCDGHWSRFHRFFSHAAWDIDAFALVLAKLVVSLIAPGATLLWAVDDTLCRRRGLTLYGAGMHYDPLLSSRKKKLVSWGHDWVVLCIVIVHPFWAPTTIQALYYKSGGDRLLRIVLVRDTEGGRPDQMFYCTKLDWDVRQILSTYACRWAIECTFENCKQLMGLGEQANRVPKAIERTAPMAFFLSSLVVVWFDRVGHQFLRFPVRPWYGRKQEPSFADMLTTLRRVSYDEKTGPLLPEQSGLKTWVAQITELLSRAG